MTDEPEGIEDIEDGLPYEELDQVDFSVITSKLRTLPFFEDDVWLGMQAMNVGIVDTVITHNEYGLLREYGEIEKTPLDTAMAVSAMSQMWVYGLYEVLRMWRDRRYQFKKLFENGGVELKLAGLPDDDELNLAASARRRQLERYRDDEGYRQSVDAAWETLEPVFRLVELFRINLAKHCAPGKDNSIPRAPGYGRINMYCGAMDYELLDGTGFYQLVNRREIADELRKALVKH